MQASIDEARLGRSEGGIPTDSLHRFCAITGLLLLVVTTAYLGLRSEQYT